MVTVIGAGMAGLLAAAMFRKECDCVLEAQAALPNNHSAVLRFRSTAVSNALNIPFKKVHVFKAVHGGVNPVADAMAYSYKCIGRYDGTRSIGLGQPEIVTRYIAPPNLVERMAAAVSAPICFGTKADAAMMADPSVPVISTIPMPTAMRLLGWAPRQSAFQNIVGANVSFKILHADCYVSVYVPDPTIVFSRVSITGDKAIAEIPMPLGEYDINPLAVAREAIKLLGVQPYMIDKDTIALTNQTYSKIIEIDDEERKAFIMWATEKHNVYSLGRYATWRPGLLLDDVVNDVRVIHGLMMGHGRYERKK